MKRVSLRVPEALWNEVRDSAMKHDRSMHKHIIHMIKDWLWRDRKKVNWWGTSYKRNGK